MSKGYGLKNGLMDSEHDGTIDSPKRLKNNKVLSRVHLDNKIHYCSCGKIASGYSRIGERWMCPTCHELLCV